MNPTVLLDEELSDGVVVEKIFIERLEPDAQHSQEALDEDDAFLALAGTEVWEYEVVNERRDEFEDAIRNSKVVFESTVVDDSAASENEASEIPSERDRIVPQRPNPASDTGTRAGSGVRATEYDGPAGQPTGNASAGTPVRRGPLPREDVEGLGEAGSGGLDELTIRDESDPDLGLTDSGDPGADWAADTGPSRNQTHGVQTRDLSDKGSELKPVEQSAPKKTGSPTGAPRRRRKTG